MAHKHINYSRIVLAGLIILMITSCSRTGFRGTIEYNLTYPGSRIDYATQEALPSSVEIISNNNLLKKQYKGGGELGQVQITDSDEETVNILLEIMGNRYHIIRTRNEIMAATLEMPEPKLEFTGETKEIMGYVCQKVHAITYDDFGNETVSEIYFTSEIDGKPFNFDTPYRDIPGLMLIYELRVGDVNMRYEVERIRTRRRGTGRRNFKIPRGYQTTTYEELRRELE